MILKAAWRNIISKPLRAVATVLAVAVTVAMIFCMLSFKSAVHDYIYASVTADSGNSDVKITYKNDGGSPKLLDPSLLDGTEGISVKVPVLSLFAKFGGEYVRVRGFGDGAVERLQKVNVKSGDINLLNENDDYIVVSERAAKRFGLSAGDPVDLELGNKKISFYVAAVAANDGYFTSDSPYVFVGNCGGGVARLMPDPFNGSPVYNEIYVKAAPGANTAALTARIERIYPKMKVGASGDSASIETKTTGLSAPIVVAGAAIVVLGLASVALLFMTGEKEKINYASRLSVIGATKGKIFSIFLMESIILSVGGAVIGAALASGVFIGLLALTLGSALSFSVSPLNLIGSALLGVVVSIAAATAPLIRTFNRSARENQLGGTAKKKRPAYILPIVLIAVTAVCVTLEYTVPGLKGVMSVVNIALVFAALGAVLPAALTGTAKLTEKSSSPPVKVASVTMPRDKRFPRSLTVLTVGMLTSMMLFTAWSLTTGVYDSYTSDFDNMAIVTNVRSDVDTSQIESVDGVKRAIPMVMREVRIKAGKADKAVTLFGNADMLGTLDFKYRTSKSLIEERLKINPGDEGYKPYVVLDYAMSALFGIEEGDTVYVETDAAAKPFTVAGIVEHLLFSGNYAIIPLNTVEAEFGISVDTVFTETSGDVKSVIGRISERFAKENYYAVSVNDYLKWEQQSMNSIFDLIGILAAIITLFAFGVSVATVISGRASAERERQTMLAAGISKNDLLKTEIFEHGISAVIAFVFATAVSVLLAACLINAMRLFGLYFPFMYDAVPIVAVGLSVAAAYTLLPLALNYKKRYNLKKQ